MCPARHNKCSNGWFGGRRRVTSATSLVLLVVVEHPQEREQHFTFGARVLRVQFEDSALIVLDGVSFAVGVVYFLKLLRDRVTLLRQSTVGLPVPAECASRRKTGFVEEARVIGAGVLGRGATCIPGVIEEYTQQREQHFVRRTGELRVLLE